MPAHSLGAAGRRTGSPAGAAWLAGSPTGLCMMGPVVPLRTHSLTHSLTHLTRSVPVIAARRSSACLLLYPVGLREREGAR